MYSSVLIEGQINHTHQKWKQIMITNQLIHSTMKIIDNNNNNNYHLMVNLAELLVITP